MVLPLIPIAIGAAGVAAGAALQHWIAGTSPDPWEDATVFNARMREMHGLGLSLNEGLKTCKAFTTNAPQVSAWRTLIDTFGKFYTEVGTLSWDPSEAEVAQAKDFASKYYFWTEEYNRICSSNRLTPTEKTDPYKPAPLPDTPTDYAGIIKWSAIGLGSLIGLKLISDLLRK